MLVEAGKQRILQTCCPKALYLFGSAATGQMTDQSDLDFLAVFANELELKAARARYYSTPAGHGHPTDLVLVTAADFIRRSKVGGVCMVCLQEGRLLFGGLHD